jgi:glycosyltransferase involved in cell wall biosynthesis
MFYKKIEAKKIILQNMKPKFKIGIDARMYGNEQTGIGNYIKHLIKYLAEFDQENEYRIFLLEPEFSRFVLPGKNFEKIKVTAHWYSWVEQIILPFQFRKKKLDLMHFPHFNAPIFYSGKRVITIHDLTPKFFPGHKMNSFFRRTGFWFVFYFGIKKAKKIIVPSRATKNDIIKYFKTKPEKIEVIYEGINFKKKSQTPNVRDSRHSVSETSQKYILYIGVWRNHKNLIGLIKAFDILLKKYKVDCKLVLGGKENPYYPEIRKTWQSLNLKKNIVCPGFIPEKDLSIFYQNAELVVIPSFYEGFGLVGLEAMSFGKPVVCSDIPALKEVFGSAALFFNPYNPSDMAEKIFKVLKDKKIKQDLIIKGFKQIEKYSWEKMVQRTLEIYKEVLKNGIGK